MNTVMQVVIAEATHNTKGTAVSWTDERVEILTKLWAEGLSASQIAGQLGGVTRNAVIGKVHRLGLSGRVTTNRSSRTRQPVTRKPSQPPRPVLHGITREIGANHKPPRLADLVPIPEPVTEPALFDGKPATVLTLTAQTCKWPIGNPGEEHFHFCGQKTDRAAPPYCAYHSRLAYQTAQPKRRAKANSTASGALPIRTAVNN